MQAARAKTAAVPAAYLQLLQFMYRLLFFRNWASCLYKQVIFWLVACQGPGSDAPCNARVATMQHVLLLWNSHQLRRPVHHLCHHDVYKRWGAAGSSKTVCDPKHNARWARVQHADLLRCGADTQIQHLKQDVLPFILFMVSTT